MSNVTIHHSRNTSVGFLQNIDTRSRNMSRRFLRNTLIGLFIIGSIYVLGISLFVLSPDIKNHFSGREFNAVAWQNWQESEAELSLRWEMTKDLTDRYELKGMPITEVKELLGEPDNEYAEGTITYYLGMSGHGIDTGSLILTIKNGVVVDYEVWHG